MKKRPKPAYVVYLGSAHNRLIKNGPIPRAEGPYSFYPGQPTEVGPLKTDGHHVLPMSAGVPGGVLWATDNMEFFEELAEVNPGQWAYFTKKPSEKALEDVMPAEDAKKAEDA